MVASYKSVYRLTVVGLILIIGMLSGALLHANAGVGESVALANSASVDGLSSGVLAATEESVHSVVAATADHPTSGQQTVDVMHGDTMWKIAEEHLPHGESVRSYMKKIKKVNHLTNSDLKEGQMLVLP